MLQLFFSLFLVYRKGYDADLEKEEKGKGEKRKGKERERRERERMGISLALTPCIFYYFWQGRTFFFPTLCLTLFFTARDSISFSSFGDLPASPKKLQSYPSYSPRQKGTIHYVLLSFLLGVLEKEGKGKRKGNGNGKEFFCSAGLFLNDRAIYFQPAEPIF